MLPDNRTEYLIARLDIVVCNCLAVIINLSRTALALDSSKVRASHPHWRVHACSWWPDIVLRRRRDQRAMTVWSLPSLDKEGPAHGLSKSGWIASNLSPSRSSPPLPLRFWWSVSSLCGTVKHVRFGEQLFTAAAVLHSIQWRARRPTGSWVAHAIALSDAPASSKAVYIRCRASIPLYDIRMHYINSTPSDIPSKSIWTIDTRAGVSCLCRGASNQIIVR
jgi:hypothetical protein